MPGGARKGAQASSTRAANFLQQKTNSGYAGAGFAGFSGGRLVGAQAAEEETAVGGIGGLDGRVQQYLKHLAKANSTTKLKALQGLYEEVQQQNVGELLSLLPHWIRAYRRLVTDMNRNVRMKCQEVLGAVAVMLKRELAPHLKILIGPWWMSQHDADRDVSAAATDAYHRSFTESKRTEVILFCHQELLKYLQDNLYLDAKELGNSKSDGKHEKEMQYDSLMSGSLSAMAGLLVMATSADEGSTSRQNVANGVTQLISSNYFLKNLFSSKNPLVRKDAYHLVQEACTRAKKEMAVHVPSTSQQIVGSIAEKDGSCQSSAWSMVLTFIQAFPDSWTYVHLQKAILPRLYSYLTHRGYGQEFESYSAILPFISEIPDAAWEGSPEILVKATLSTWTGAQGQTARSIQEASIRLMVECLIWGLLSGGNLSSDPKSFQEELITGTFSNVMLPAAIEGSEVNSSLGKSVIREVMTKLAEAAKGDSESPAGIALRALLLSLTSFFKPIIASAVSPKDSQTGTDSSDENISHIACVLLDLIPNFSTSGLSSFSDEIARPLGEVIAGDGISQHSDVEALGSLTKLSKVFGTAVLSFVDTDPESTPSSILDSTFDQILPLFVSGTLNDTRKAGFAELMLAALRSVDDSVRVRKWSSMLQVFRERMESSSKDWEKSMEFFNWLLLEIVELDTGSRTHFSCPELGSLVESMSNRERLKSEAVVSVISTLVHHQSDLLDSQSLVYIYESVLSIMRDALDDTKRDCFDASLLAGAFRIVKDSLFDGGLPYCDKGLTVWSEVVVTLAKLSWENNQDSDRGNFHQAETVWSSGTKLKVLYSRVPQQVHKILGCLQDHVVHSLEAIAQNDVRSLACSTSELLDLAFDSSAKQKTMESILSSCEASWLKWCAGPDHVHQQDYHAVIDFVVCLIGLTSHEDVIGGTDTSQRRPWLVVELLCECQCGSVDSEVYDGLVDHLVVSSLLSMCHEARVEDQMIVKALEKCMEGTLGSQTGATFVKVVQTVLSALVDHVSEQGTIDILSYFVSNCLFNAIDMSNEAWKERQTHEDVLLKLLPLVAAPLRTSEMDHFKDSHLGDMSLCWVEAGKMFLSQTSAGNDVSPSLSLRTLQTALAFFPVDPAMGFGRNMDLCLLNSETKELLNLFRHQAAEPGIQSESSMENSSAASREMRKILGDLDFAATAYCHDLFDEDDWRGMLDRIQAMIHGGSLCLDNMVEIFSGAVVSVAENRVQVDSATMALQLVGRMTEKGLISGCEVLEAVDSLWSSGMVEDLKTSTAAVKSLLLVLNLDPEGRTAIAREKWLCENVVQVALGHGARCALCGAAMLSIAESCGKEVFSAVQKLMSDTDEFWDAVAELVELAMESGTAVSEALESMDIWAEEIGVEGLQCALALAFSPHPFTKLQKVGAKMLAQQPTINQLTVHEELEEEEEDAEQWKEGHIAQEMDIPAFLKNSGVHRRLASLLPYQDSLATFLLSWSFMLIHLISLPEGSKQRKHFTSTLSNPFTLVSSLLNHLITLLPLPEPQERNVSEVVEIGGKSLSLQGFVARVGIPEGSEEWQTLAVKMYRVVLTVLPSSARTWFADLKDRWKLGAVETYTAVNESQALIKHELDLVEAAGNEPTEGFRTKCIPSRGEVIATKEIEDGAFHELLIRVPKCMPLRPAEVECQRRVGVSETQQRKWLLAICTFLRHQNSSILEAVTLWKRNLDRGFQGVEPCLICYSVIHPTARTLPVLRCTTCSVQFHAACLYRWFRQCGKSQCPHCQSPWSSGSRPE